MTNKFTWNKSCVQSIDGIVYLDLNEKTYYDNGYASGMLLNKSNNKALAFFQNPIVRAFCAAYSHIKKKHLENIRIPQEYLDELKGYADGANLPYDILFFYNFAYDIFTKGVPHCSSFAFFNKDKSVIIGHNTDIGPFLAHLALKYTKSMVIKVSMPHQIPYAHVSLPFFVGAMNGFNKQNLAVNSHEVSYGYKSQNSSLATPLLMRMILENAETMQGAHNLVRQNLPQSPINLMITNQKGGLSRVYEITPSGFGFVDNDENHLCCTNHFSSEEMRHQQSQIRRNSEDRFSSLEDLLKSRKEVTVEDAVAILKDTRHGLRWNSATHSLTNKGTFQSFVFDIGERAIYISNGSKSPVSLNGEYVKVKVKL